MGSPEALSHIDGHVMTGKLPRVKIQPVVWNLNLVSVNDLLLEDAISISKAVTPCGIVQGGKAVKEASSQATQATVSEGSIVLLGDNILDPEAKLGEAAWYRMCQCAVLWRSRYQCGAHLWPSL